MPFDAQKSDLDAPIDVDTRHKWDGGVDLGGAFFLITFLSLMQKIKWTGKIEIFFPTSPSLSVTSHKSQQASINPGIHSQP